MDLPTSPCYPSLRGKRVVITGGASGIGLATARRFKAEGASVFVFDRNELALGEAIAQGAADHGAAIDVGSQEQVKRGFAQVMRELDGVDVLIANAGVSFRTPFMDITEAQWRTLMSVNLDGAFYCCQEGARQMKQQRSGSILLTASTNGLDGHPFYADYNASKAGLLVLMKTMALELAPHVRVNAVSPGYVLTPMQLAEYTEEMLAAVNAKLPLQRHAAPEEVGALFAFLASDQANYLTGQNFVIDGGETA